jgi:hypothetical protein
VSTWKKSTARAAEVWARRNCRQLVSRRRVGAGGYPGAFEDPADRRGGDPVAEFAQLSPEALVSHDGLSLASRSMSRTTSSGSGGRPVRLG